MQKLIQIVIFGKIIFIINQSEKQTYTKRYHFKYLERKTGLGCFLQLGKSKHKMGLVRDFGPKKMQGAGSEGKDN